MRDEDVGPASFASAASVFAFASAQAKPDTLRPDGLGAGGQEPHQELESST